MTPNETGELHASAATEVDSEIGPLSRPSEGLPRSGATLGRYVIIDRIGRGGMGEVLRAYDPELDRVVAVKLVRYADEGKTSELRLQREAQAIAKLSHPNVVQVFDVGTDERSGHLFIAMEYVPGQNLRDWLRERPRTWTEIATVFAEAGEGLLAAHQCGIVHRDFKPENVLVDMSGRAKVLDFGLAKPEQGGPGEVRYEASARAAQTLLARARDSSAGASGSGSVLSSNLTRDGARVGTPAYMPPEQIAGVRVDARADQFSFAVALYEAAFGRLPFNGTTTEAYAFEVLDGHVQPIPSDTRVPRTVQRAILRALSPEREARFDELRPLLDELTQDPARARRRSITWMALGIVGAALAGVGFLMGSDGGDPARAHCTAAGERVAAVWNPAVGRQLFAAFDGVPAAFAQETAERVSRGLDRVAQRWSSARRDACLDAAAGTASTEFAQARDQCLETELARTRQIVETLLDPSPEAITFAVEAVSSVDGQITHCSQPSYLAALVAGGASEDPEFAELRALLATWKTRLSLGESEAVAQELKDGPAPPDDGRWPAALVMEWATLAASALQHGGHFEDARATLDRAAHLSVGQAAPFEALYLEVGLADLAYDVGDLETMRMGYARAYSLAREHLPDDDREVISALAMQGHYPYATGDYAGALGYFREASEQAHRALPERDTIIPLIDSWTGDALVSLDRHEEGFVYLRGAIEQYTQALGPSHPQTLEARSALAISLLKAGLAQPALLELEASLAAERRAYDRISPLDEAALLANIGSALSKLDRNDEATLRLREAIGRMADADPERESPQFAAIEAALGGVLAAQNRHEEAVEILEHALAGLERTGRDRTLNGIMVRHNIGVSLRALGRDAAALQPVEEAGSIAEETGNALLLGRCELLHARVLDTLGRRQAAETALAAAREAFDHAEGAEPWQAELVTYLGVR